MEPDSSSLSSKPPLRQEEMVRRARVIGFTGMGVCFMISQMGLLWVLATGGIGSNPSIAGTVWLFSTLVTVFFLLILADSYRHTPRWLREVARTPALPNEERDIPDRVPAKVS